MIIKKTLLMKINYQIKKDQNYTFKDEAVRTTNINILLNRVRQKNKSESKKKIIFSIFIIGILSLLSIIVFVN
jgi:hypothetical protein